MKNRIHLYVATMAAAVAGLVGCAQGPDKNVVVYEMVEVGEQEFKGRAQNLAISGDGQNAYIATDYVSDTDPSKLFHSADLSSWTNVPYAGLLDDSPGKAKLAGANKIEGLKATHDGAIILTSIMAGSPPGATNGGGIYFKGTTASAAWDLIGGHILGVLGATVIPPVAVVRHSDGRELVVVMTDSKKGAIGELGPAKIAAELQSNSGDFVPNIIEQGGAATVGGDLWTYQTNQGLVRIKNGNIKTTGPVIAEAAADKTKTGGANTFGVGGGANRGMTSMVSLNGKLYLSFASGGIAGRGGVVICSFKNDGELDTCSNNVSWNKVGVTKLLIDPSEKIWALTSSGLLKVNEDGSKGDAWERFMAPFSTDYRSAVEGASYLQGLSLAKQGLQLQQAGFTKEGNLVILARDQQLGRGTKVMVARRRNEAIKDQ